MKIYNKIVYDIDNNIIEEDSYNYTGPIAKATGDPLTTAIIINTVFTVAGRAADMKAQNAKAAMEIAQYKREMKLAELKGLQEEKIRTAQYDETTSSNRAYWGSTGFTDDSRVLMVTQRTVKERYQSDIRDIRLTAKGAINKYAISAYGTEKMRRAQMFGGWASIGASAAEGYMTYKSYEKPKPGLKK